MRANPILLQKKYARVVTLFAEKNKLTLNEALDFFYHSILYQLMKNGISDMHCMSDDYLAEDLTEEYYK
ncbi:MAG TPA: DUF3791 domain-containing protein [Candidatus Megamonas gallistercoris]|nr:DUF3791 domain-containing protein [Candidatus Megamonas gallistercoris]